MNDELKKRLDSIVGKEYNYQNKNVTIEKYKIVSNINIVIFLDGKTLNFLEHEIDGFLNDLFPPSDKVIFKPGQVAIQKNDLMIFEPTKENVEVKNTLLETMRKIKEDKDYIPQAESICKIVSTLVDVQKTEIQMLNLISKKN